MIFSRYIFISLLLILFGCYKEEISFENPNPSIILENFSYEFLNQEAFANFLISYRDEQGDFGFDEDFQLAIESDRNMVFDIYDENNLLITSTFIIIASALGRGTIDQSFDQGRILINSQFSIFSGEVSYSQLLMKQFEPFEENKKYYFKIRAIDRAGNVSNEVSTPLF